MIAQSALGDTAFKRSRRLMVLINTGEIQFAGNSKLKIYGTLGCVSAKRMKIANRVFFGSAAEARDTGYRPCGHCMPEAYLEWKVSSTHSGMAEPVSGQEGECLALFISSQTTQNKA